MQIANCKLNATTGKPAAKGPNPRSQFSIFNFQFSICNFRRRGMTLVELLVVIAIIVLLAAATIPQLRPTMDRSRIREAARSVQLYLARPATTRLPRADVAACYRAAARGTRLLDEHEPGRIAAELLRRGRCPRWPRSAGNGGAVNITFNPGDQRRPGQSGDQIQLGLQGPFYTVRPPAGRRPPSTPARGWRPPGRAGPPRRALPGLAPARQIGRGGLAVALAGGDRSDAVRARTRGPGALPAGGLMIVFAPDGSLDRVYAGGTGTRPTGADLPLDRQPSRTSTARPRICRTTTVCGSPSTPGPA